MGFLLQKIQKRPDWSPGISAFAALWGACAALLCWAEGGADAADLSRGLPTKAPPPAISASYDWTGFYAGGHFGYAAGFSNWSATASQAIDKCRALSAAASAMRQTIGCFIATGGFAYSFDEFSRTQVARRRWHLVAIDCLADQRSFRHAAVARRRVVARSGNGARFRAQQHGRRCRVS
jgi:hypothetical protein